MVKDLFSLAVHPNGSPGSFFFAIIHLAIMPADIMVITIGSALANRKLTDLEKFSAMFYWFALAPLLILLAIPWLFHHLHKDQSKTILT